MKPKKVDSVYGAEHKIQTLDQRMWHDEGHRTPLKSAIIRSNQDILTDAFSSPRVQLCDEFRRRLGK